LLAMFFSLMGVIAHDLTVPSKTYCVQK